MNEKLTEGNYCVGLCKLNRWPETNLFLIFNWMKLIPFNCGIKIHLSHAGMERKWLSVGTYKTALIYIYFILLTHHMNSVQTEQKTGCRKNLATNLCPLMMWHFCFRMAPRRPVRPLWFSWGLPSFVGSSVYKYLFIIRNCNNHTL